MSVSMSSQKGIPPSGSKKVQVNHKIRPVADKKVSGLKIKAENIDFYKNVDGKEHSESELLLTEEDMKDSTKNINRRSESIQITPSSKISAPGKIFMHR